MHIPFTLGFAHALGSSTLIVTDGGRCRVQVPLTASMHTAFVWASPLRTNPVVSLTQGTSVPWCEHAQQWLPEIVRMML